MQKLSFFIIPFLMLPNVYGSTIECLHKDQFKSIVCSDVATISKANKFNHAFLTNYSTSPSHLELKEAIKIKNGLRKDVRFCRNNSQDPIFCLNEALDNALNQLFTFYPSISLWMKTESEASASAYAKKPYLNESYKNQILRCLSNEAARLDDGISPVSEIAKVIEATCKPEAIEYETFVWDSLYLEDILDPINVQPNFEIIVSENFGITVASKYVLESRAAKRAPLTPPNKNLRAKKKPQQPV